MLLSHLKGRRVLHLWGRFRYGDPESWQFPCAWRYYPRALVSHLSALEVDPAKHRLCGNCKRRLLDQVADGRWILRAIGGEPDA